MFKKISAEVCQLPIQHFNSVLEPYVSKKFFGRALPISNSTLQQCFDPHISKKISGRALPITNSTLQQRFGDIHVRKNFRQRSADYQFNTSTAFWSHICPKKISAELCQLPIQHFNRFLTYTYPIAKALPECRIPIQHFNSVLGATYPKNIPAELCRLPIQHF